MQPIDVAWNLLKGNPSMYDSHGQSIDHPSAMVYGKLANLIEAPAEKYPMGYIDNDFPSASDYMEYLDTQGESRPLPPGMEQFVPTPLVRHIGPSTARTLRQYARDNVHNEMDTRDSSAGANHGIERMPRPDESQVANIMDDDIQRLNPGMRNFADTSGKL